MESISPPAIAKRLRHIVRVVYYMLRKGISKRKLLLDLHLIRKRSKIARKALGNLLMTFHHHHHHHSPINLKEVEFSCSNTPSYAYNYFHSAITKRKNRRHCHHDDFDSFDAVEFAMAFQMMNMEESDAVSSTLPTPSPMMVRQLRITDSPFPLNENEDCPILRPNLAMNSVNVTNGIATPADNEMHYTTAGLPPIIFPIDNSCDNKEDSDDVLGLNNLIHSSSPSYVPNDGVGVEADVAIIIRV
ncbi:hypothetical protein M5K25_025941 [Dendrobium thyrsiflorum]|uniref:Uncharacterized protein n=1 Tax=Dendrobium thyrsiflorum TaxID=117978 RepID=A0ABD0TW70_DENTH